MNRLALLALLSSAFALPSTKRDQGLVKKTDKPANSYDSPEAFCENWDFSSEASTKEIMQKTDCLYQLDEWLVNTNGPSTDGTPGTKWLSNYVKYVTHDNGASDMAGCSNPADDCNIPDISSQCRETYNTFAPMKNLQCSYWIFQAVTKFHAKMKLLQEGMTEASMLTGFSLDTMVSDLQGSIQTTADTLNWVSQAMSMGSTLTSFVAGPEAAVASEAIGFLSGAFGTLSEWSEAPDITDSMETNLANTMSFTQNAIRETTAIAMGGGTSDQFGALPSFGDYKTSIANFFNNGFWMLDSNSDASNVNDLVNQTSANMLMRTAHEILVASNVILVRNDDIKQDTCESTTGHKWVVYEEKTGCFALGTNELIDQIKEDIYENLAKYSITDLTTYYTQILKSTDVAVDDINNSMSLPALDGSVAPTPGTVSSAWLPMAVYAYSHNSATCPAKAYCTHDKSSTWARIGGT